VLLPKTAWGQCRSGKSALVLGWKGIKLHLVYYIITFGVAPSK